MKRKYKIVNKKGRKLLIINSEKGESLNKREVEELENGTVHGVLPVEIELKRKGFSITYDLTNYIPLNQYVHTVVNKKKFVEIMLQILEIFQKLTEQYYDTKNLIMDLEKVVVNPSTNKIYFPFVPILYYDYGIADKEFLIQLIYSTTFDNSENTEYADRCLSILQKNMNFSRVELEEYLKSQVDDGNIGKKNESINKIQAIYDPAEQWIKHKEKEKEVQRSPEKVAPKEQITGKRVPREEVPEGKKIQTEKVPEKEKTVHTGGISKPVRMTGTLSDYDEGGTALLGATEESYLKQERTGQIYHLKQDVTTVGKRTCTIKILDNSVVSREHAKIERIGDDFYLQEIKATNGTKVNGRRIHPTEQVLLRDEDVIEFANEKFIFYK